MAKFHIQIIPTEPQFSFKISPNKIKGMNTQVTNISVCLYVYTYRYIENVKSTSIPIFYNIITTISYRRVL